MKSLALFGALVLAASGACAQGIVLPPDAEVREPVEAIPVAAKVFSGRWEGKWDDRMPHVLVVEDVKSGTEAAVLYAWQDAPAANTWGAGWARIAATIDGNTLRLVFRNGTKAWYEVQADGSLKAGYQRPNSSSQSNAVMQKAKP